jgi:hypothetical protein
MSISGINISTPDNGWYYTEISVPIPNEAHIIGVVYTSFSAGVIIIPRLNNSLGLMCYRSYTLPANRTVRVYYTY